MLSRSPPLPDTQWAQHRAAFIAGACLRSLARAAGIAEGTMLARAHREGWSDAKRRAHASVKATGGTPKVDAGQAIANEAAGRAERHVARMGLLCEKIGEHVESLPPGLLFEGISRLDTLDRVARRTHGLDSGNSAPVVNLLFGSSHDLAPREVFDAIEVCGDPSEWREVEV